MSSIFSIATKYRGWKYHWNFENQHWVQNQGVNTLWPKKLSGALHGDFYIPQNCVCMCGAGGGLNNNLWFIMHHVSNELPCCNVWGFFQLTVHVLPCTCNLFSKGGWSMYYSDLKWRNCSKWQVHEQLAFISKSNSALESVATKL